MFPRVMSTVLIPPHNLHLLLLYPGSPFHVLVCYETLAIRKELAVKPNLECERAKPMLAKKNVLPSELAEWLEAIMVRCVWLREYVPTFPSLPLQRLTGTPAGFHEETDLRLKEEASMAGVDDGVIRGRLRGRTKYDRECVGGQERLKFKATAYVTE